MRHLLARNADGRATGALRERETMNVYAAAFEAAGVCGADVRWRVEHAQHLHPDDMPRLKELVTRALPDGSRFFEAQKMTREEALYRDTMAGACAGFEEAEKGSVTVGKVADLLVLSQDLLTVPEDRIRDTKVDLTFVHARQVHAREGT